MTKSLVLLCCWLAIVLTTLQLCGASLEVRLVNGKTQFQGRLEVRFNESDSWGTVCDDGFDQNDANVVCRMLGFEDTEYATYFREPSPYGPGKGDILLGNINCDGNETNLSQCRSESGVSGCSHNEDVGINCQTPIRLTGGSSHSGKVEVKSNGTWKPLCYDAADENTGKVLCKMLALSDGNVFVTAGAASNEDYHTIHPNCTGREDDISQCFATESTCSQNKTVDLKCRTKIRLQGGPHNQSGRVEVFFQNKWGTICDDSFEATAGEVVEDPASSVICRMLGFRTKGAVHIGGAYYGAGTGMVWIDQLTCKGDEMDIADCDYKQWGSHTNCQHSEDISVECGTEVRLVGGSTPFSGRVEIHHDDRWNTMCDESFDNRTAQVLCNMLGFPRGNASVHGEAYYGQGGGDMVDYELECYGNETDIVNCRHEIRQTQCNHSHDVGINCYSVTPIRLQGGPTPLSGRVEIYSYSQQIWTGICDTSYGFTKNDADVLCNMIGKPNNSPTYHRADTLYEYVILGKGVANMSCKGSEKDISDCLSGHFWNKSTCSNPYYIGINCDPITPIRLVDGSSNMVGRVEILFNNTWGSICYTGYTNEYYLAKIICKMVGSSGSSTYTATPYHHPTIISSISCRGFENDISDCKSTKWSATNSCPYQNSFGVECGSKVQLINGTTTRSGRVEVLFNGSWTSICAADFEENAGNVVCRMAGLNVWNVSVLPGNYFGRGGADVYLNSTNCTGKEEDLIHCRSGPWKQAECEDDFVAAVDCQYWKTDLRLVNGNTPYSGRVEVFFNNRWGTVCQHSFDVQNAAVVCRTLGYNFSTDVSVVNDLYDGNFVPYQVIVQSLSCYGNEKDISMCRSARWDSGYSDCLSGTSYHSVGVNCLTSVRLSGGTEAIGQVEVYHKGSWTTICATHFVENNIPVLCSMLGLNYTHGNKMIGNIFHTSYGETPTIHNLTCTGTETDIQQCRSGSWESSGCRSRNAAAISCHTPVQLVGEDNWYRGKVQIWSHNLWIDVCYDENITQMAQVGRIVCLMLGMTNANIRHYHVEGRTDSFKVSCSGKEKDMSRCNLARLSCPNSKRLAIACDVDIKLEGGRTEYMGAISVNMFDRWGTIYGIKNDNAAKVACRTLGLNFWSEAEVQNSGQFRGSSCSYVNIPMLDCIGNETDIMMCSNTYPAKDEYTSYCYSTSVGVNCQTPVRLANGSQYQYGRIEVKNNGSWFPVCSEHFDINSAYVFCRMLGHHHFKNATFRSDTYSSGDSVMKSVKCNGSEVDIFQCDNKWLKPCPSERAVYLDCRSTIRLADGPTPFIGRAEVFYEGHWGTINKNSVTTVILTLFCKILGFNFAGAQVYNRPNVLISPGNRVTNHTINNLQCVGNEEDITECQSEPWMSYKEYYDAGPLEIACLTPIRLVGGSNSNVGKVIAQYKTTEFSVCGDNFTLADADVVCRNIGQETNMNTTIYFNNKFGNGNTYVVDNLRCVGKEIDIQACQSDQWVSQSSICSPGNNAVSVNCRPKTPIRLSGSSNYSGIIEINYKDYWGTICYDSFDVKDAYVICRMLGFKSSVSYYYTYGGSSAVIKELNCQGYEKDVSECSNSYNSWYTGTYCTSYNGYATTVTCSNDWVKLEGGVNDYQGRVEFQYIGLTGLVCDTYFDPNDADVVCRHLGFKEGNKTIYKANHFGSKTSTLIVDDLNCTGLENDIDECISYPWSANQYLCSTTSAGAAVNCRPNTPIRLMNGTNLYSGRVEIEYKGAFGAVCDMDFDENDAKVVCRMLGYNTLSTAVRQRAFFGQGTGQIIISHLNCMGYEPDISECGTAYNYRWNSPYGYCTHSDDVSVQCDTPVRVRGGWTAYSGAVEIHINGSWQSVCYNEFTNRDAEVICNTSGLTKNYRRITNATIYKESYYGLKSKPSHIGNLGCSGNEGDLFFCGTGKWTTHNMPCNADNNVAINCRPITSLRLMHGSTEVSLHVQGKQPVSGRVEILYNDKWGSICDDQFDNSDAFVICKMIGFSAGRVNGETDHGTSTGLITVDDLECLGTENDISECKAREWGTHNCGHDEDIAVTCDFMENIDPCKLSEHVRLPRLETRYLNSLTTILNAVYNDSVLPLAWYNVGKNPMPNRPPDKEGCGTRFPIYSTDELPQPGQEPKLINATQVGSGEIHYKILVKACLNGDFVYWLGPTVNDQSGYCFGIGSTDPPPNFIAKDVSTLVRKERFSVSFGCKFTSSDENLLYQVLWYIEGNYQHSFTKQFYNSSSLQESDLSENDFEQFGIGLGIYISCAVRAYNSTDGQPGPMSERSPPLFVGIQVLTPTITLRKGETKSIELEPTIPLVCDEGFESVCKITLEQNIPDYNSCSNTVTFASRACSTTINNSSYQDITTIDIRTSETEKYGVQGHFKVNLMFTPNRNKRLNVVKFWKKQYKIPAINVHVLPEEDKSWRGSICTAQNDPHMHTFDGKAYEHHEEAGEYILYRHKLFNNVEIQHKIASCVGTNGVAKCNCGVAVRAGRDVYVINVCERLLDIGYKRCQDESLTVKKNNDFTYTMYLPYGTAIRARIDNQPWMGNEGGRVVDISILSSVYDHGGNSSGLCGTLNTDIEDDFHHRNGSVIESASGKKEFISSWKVREDESLFSLNVFKMELTPWSFPACVCKEQTKADVPVTCDRSIAECAPGMTSGQHSCGGVSERRTVRSVSKRPRIPVVMQTDHYSSTNQHSRKKRMAAMSVTMARNTCENFFQSLKAFQLCQKVPSTHTSISVDNCVQDILLTNSTEWMKISQQSMLDTCLTEIHRNASVREEALNNAKNESMQTNSTLQGGTTVSPVQLAEMIKELQEIENIVNEITVITCLNGCSGHGRCMNGTCICETNFGASDCSLDINKPPRLAGILDKGLCDEKDHDCSHIYVFGEVFAGTNLTCRLNRFTMRPWQGKEMKETYTLKGMADSLIEAICPIEHLRQRRSSDEDDCEETPLEFVHGYRVAISNDGLQFGNEAEDLYIFDSTCQTWSKATGEMKFSLKDGFCFIDGRCVSNGTISVSQKMVCDPNIAMFSWSSTAKQTPTTTLTFTTSQVAGYAGIPCNKCVRLRACEEHDSCVMENDTPICIKPIHDQTSNTSRLITIIASTVGGVLVLVIIVVVVCRCRTVRRKLKITRSAARQQNENVEKNSTEMLERPKETKYSDFAASDNLSYNTRFRPPKDVHG